MTIIAIADDDSLVGKLSGKSVELLISLGDIWDSTITKAQATYGCSTTFAVKGNHDSAAPFASNITNLHLAVDGHCGLVFGGFGGSWKYKPRGHHLYEQQEVSDAMRSFPAVDVFIAHNSPRGIHERDADVHQGFDAFLDYIDRTQPAYFLHGHQHVNKSLVRGATTILGVFGERAIELTPR